MNPNQPTPSDLCECGHSRNAHSNGDTLCWSYKCPCTNFKPATPQPEPSNTMNEFEVKAYTDEYLAQQLEKAKVVLGMFEQEFSRRNAELKRRVKELEDLNTELNQLMRITTEALFQQPETAAVEKEPQEVDDLEARCQLAESELCNIYVLCGNTDPADGEGIRCDEITEAVRVLLRTLRAELATLSQDKEKMKEALRTHGAHRSNCRCLEPFRNFECSCGLSQALEFTSETDTQTAKTTVSQCSYKSPQTSPRSQDKAK